jgi:hypothetical protein
MNVSPGGHTGIEDKELADALVDEVPHHPLLHQPLLPHLIRQLRRHHQNTAAVSEVMPMEEQ